jgi:hypothetical protein
VNGRKWQTSRTPLSWEREHRLTEGPLDRAQRLTVRQLLLGALLGFDECIQMRLERNQSIHQRRVAVIVDNA